MNAGAPVLVDQFSGKGEKTRERLICLLGRPGLERVRFVVSYARWEGLGLISAHIEKFLASGGRFECIFGAGNGITTSDALYYGLVLEKQFPGRTYAGFVEDKFANASFHPKYYEFRFKTETVAIVGSANLTGGGLRRNSEIGVELVAPRGHVVEKELAAYWKSALAMAKNTTVEAVRAVAAAPGAGREGKDESGGAKKGKPYLRTSGKIAPKPLFAKLLGLNKLPRRKKDELLGAMTALTERPKHLYIQIMKRETGGSGGMPGTAVQFPVATLGPFFGVAKDEERTVKIQFPSDEISPSFMHLPNNTHRLRIKQILEVKRPAILHLNWISPDRFEGRFIAPRSYEKVLAKKCTEQSRKGARKWGME